MFTIKNKSSFSFGAVILTLSLFFHTNLEAVGAKSSSLTSPQDAFSTATNPALSVLVGDRFDVCARYFHNPMHASAKGNVIPGVNGSYNASKRKDYFFFEGAANKVVKVCFLNSPSQMSFGLYAYTDNFTRSTYTRPIPALGTTDYGGKGWAQVYGAAVGIKVANHQFGISIDVFHTIRNTKGLQNFDNAALSVAPGFVTNKGDDDHWGFGPVFGWRCDVTKQFSLAALYRPKIRMSRYHKYKGLVPERGHSDVPTKVAVGIGYLITEQIHVSFDFEWVNFKNVQLHLPLLNAQGGINKIGSNKSPYQGFRDQYQFRLGLGYRISEEWTVRAGYIHVNKIVPRSQTGLNLNTCLACTDFVGTNATYSWGKNEVTALYVHGFRNSIKGRNSVPAVLGGGEANIRESRDYLSINYGRKF